MRLVPYAVLRWRLSVAAGYGEEGTREGRSRPGEGASDAVRGCHVPGVRAAVEPRGGQESFEGKMKALPGVPGAIDGHFS